MLHLNSKTSIKFKNKKPVSAHWVGLNDEPFSELVSEIKNALSEMGWLVKISTPRPEDADWVADITPDSYKEGMSDALIGIYNPPNDYIEKRAYDFGSLAGGKR